MFIEANKKVDKREEPLKVWSTELSGDHPNHGLLIRCNGG